MKMQFEAGEGRHFDNVNFLIGKDGDIEIYAEVEVPDGASDDYGYITMKKALISKLPEEITDSITWQYDGQEQYLEDDASADCEVYIDISGVTPTVKEIIMASGMSQTKFAERFDIPYRTVQNWYSGTRQCPEYVRKMMVEILDI